MSGHLTIEEAAAKFGVSTGLLRAFIREGAPCSRWGRRWMFPSELLDEWLLERARNDGERRGRASVIRCDDVLPEPRKRRVADRPADAPPTMYTPKNSQLLKQLRT